jgi:hypothetical protein
MDIFIRSVAMVSRACGFVAGLLILISILVVTHMVFQRWSWPSCW